MLTGLIAINLFFAIMLAVLIYATYRYWKNRDKDTF